MKFPKELEDNIRDILVDITDDTDGVDLKVTHLDGGLTSNLVKDETDEKYPSIKINISSAKEGTIKIEDIIDSLKRLDLFCETNGCIISIICVTDRDGYDIYNSSVVQYHYHIGKRGNKILSYDKMRRTPRSFYFLSHIFRPETITCSIFNFYIIHTNYLSNNLILSLALLNFSL